MSTIRTIFVLNGLPFQESSRKKDPKDIFTEDEIDSMEPTDLEGKSRDELSALYQKLSDTYDELYAPDDCEVGSPAWWKWEERLDHLDTMMASIEEMLEEDTDEDEGEDKCDMFYGRR